MADLTKLIINDTGSITPPTGNSSNRPTTSKTVDSFTSTGTTSWTAPAGVTSVEVLVVAAGGGGGSDNGGGGGAGGVIYKPSYPVIPGTSYTVTVGSGGIGANGGSGGTAREPQNGGNSVFGTLVAIGGGHGGSGGNNGQVVDNTASVGGSGGGASGESSPGGAGAAGIDGQGNRGGTSVNSIRAANGLSGSNGGSGGGGAGGPGENADQVNTYGGNGGPGLPFSITGTAKWYGGGGAGANENNVGVPFAVGGVGGGGNAAFSGTNLVAEATQNGQANTGGGGAGGTYNGVAGSPGGTGGSGVVIIAYSTTSSEDSTGLLRYNSDLNTYEIYDNKNDWSNNSNVADLVTEGLVHYFDAANYTSGTTWYDLSGNGNNGSLQNSPTYSSDYGGYFSWDYSSQYVTTSGSDNLSFPDGVTVAFWHWNGGGTGSYRGIANNGTVSDRQGGFDMRYGRENPGGLANDGTSLNWRITTSSGTDSINMYAPPRGWHYYVGTYDNKTMKLYRDGVLATTKNHANYGQLKTMADSITIGRSPGTPEYIDGRLGSIQIYRGALTEEQVRKNYNATAARFGAAAIEPYKFPIVKRGLEFNIDAGDPASLTNRYGLRQWRDLQGGFYGTINGTVTYNDGNGGYMDFDGASGYVQFTQWSNSFPLESMEFWMYNNLQIPNNEGTFSGVPGTQPYMSLITLNNVSGASAAGVNLGGWTSSATNEAWHIWNSSVITYNREGTLPGWHHVVFNWNGTHYDIWIDNVKTTVYPNTSGNYAAKLTVNAVRVGGDTSSEYYFWGRIGSVRMYSTALSDQDIAQNFEALRRRYGI